MVVLYIKNQHKLPQAKQARIKELKAKAAELEKRVNAAGNSQAYHDLKEQASDYRARAIALEIGGENAEKLVKI